MVTQHEFEDAKDKVMMGSRAALARDDRRGKKLLTAYHEGGARDRRAARAGNGSRAQGHDHSARARALGMVMQVAGARQAFDVLRADDPRGSRS